MRFPRFRELQWLFPAAAALHNGEEAIWMPQWSLNHAARLPVDPPSASLIRISLMVLTLAAFLVTYLSMREGPQSLWTYLTFGSVIAMLLNVFVPHLPASIVFQGYTPGVVTAVLINLPVMSLLATTALRERWVSGWKAAGFGVGVPLLLAAAIFSLYRLAGSMVRADGTFVLGI